MKTKDNKGNLSSNVLILIFILLATGILAAGYLFYSNYAKNYRAQVEQQLSAIADLKVGELVQWRKERLGDANLLYKNPAFSGLVQRYFEQPDDVDTQEQLRSWLAQFQAYGQYARIFLLDTRGAARISIQDTAEPVPRHIPQDAAQVLQSGKVTILDLDRDEDTPQPHMAILTPIFKEKDTNVPLGVVVMRIDPYQYLYPLIQEWPVPSTTAETLIIRRDGNDALFLNDLRFQKDTALKLRTSLDNFKMPAVQAALGHEGIMEGIDYRGVPVIADVRAIPDSPWFMVARIDTSEVYTPLTQMIWLIIALIGALLIGAGAAVGLVWRQQNIRVYKERVEIADALLESELRYRDLVNYSKNGVAIYEATADGEDFIFKDFNRAAEGIDNVKKEDIIGKSVLQTFPGVKEFGLFEVFKRVWRTGVPERYPITQYHDERISGWRDNYVYRLSSGEIVAIYEDVTARKQAEEALRESEERWQFALEGAGDGLWDWNVPTNQLYFSPRWKALLGYGENEIGDTLDEWDKRLHPDDYVRVYNDLGRHFEGVTPVFISEYRLLCKDGTYRWMLGRGKTVTRTAEGQPLRVVGTQTDITEHKQSQEALRVREVKYRTLFESFPLGITMSDSAGNIIESNKEAARLLGLSVEEQNKRQIDGREWHIIRPDGSPMPPDDYASVRALKENRLIKNVEMGIVKYDSGITWISVTAAPILLEGYGVVIAYGDITQRKLTDEKLLKSEQLLKEAQEVAHIGHWELDLATMIPSWSEEIFNIFGIDPATGEPSFAAHHDLLHPDDWDILNNAVSATSTTGAPFDIEFRLCHPLKGIRWMLAIGRTIRNDAGNISRLFGTAQDITERKLAEEALQVSESKYRSIVETAGAGVASVDLQGNLTFVNNTFIEMMGYTGEELAGKPFLNFIHPDDRKQLQDKFLTGLEKPENRPDLEFRAVQKNGNYVWLYSSPTPVIIEGNLTGFTAIATDITDRKNTESQLLVSHDHLKNLTARLQISREDERKNIAVEIHDDLGQSLTALQIDLAWLLKRMPPDQEKLLEKTKSMLSLVKVTDQKVREIATELRPPLLDDLGFVPAAQSYLREFEERTGIKCKFSNEPEEIILDANVSIALFRVLQGALTNTAKHSNATLAKISLVEQTDGLYMEISDNGRGITEKEIASRKSIGIIGMRERIAFFGGSLQIEGRHGKGTTVKVKIPVQGEIFE